MTATMATIKELEEAAQTARDNDIEAITTLISLARTFVMQHREGRVDPGLVVALTFAVDSQRETAHARILTITAWLEACAQQAAEAP